MLGMTVDEMEDMKAEIARRAKEAEKEKEHEMLRNRLVSGVEWTEAGGAEDSIYDDQDDTEERESELDRKLRKTEEAQRVLTSESFEVGSNMLAGVMLGAGGLQQQNGDGAEAEAEAEAEADSEEERDGAPDGELQPSRPPGGPSTKQKGTPKHRRMSEALSERSVRNTLTDRRGSESMKVDNARFSAFNLAMHASLEREVEKMYEADEAEEKKEPDEEDYEGEEDFEEDDEAGGEGGGAGGGGGEEDYEDADFEADDDYEDEFEEDDDDGGGAGLP
jgi:hypothetical protein